MTIWLTNNCNTHIDQYSKSKDNEAMKFGHLIGHNTRNIFLEKLYTKCGGKTTANHLLMRFYIKNRSGTSLHTSYSA